MYAETGVMFPFIHHHQFDDFCCTSHNHNHTHKLNASSLGLIQTSTISDYNLGDLFKAPEPVICEPPVMGIDPVTAAISMISCGEDVVISPQLLTVSDIESSIESGQLLSDMFYECKKDLLAKEEIEMPLPQAISVQIPTDEKVVVDEKLIVGESPFQKSVSSNCLRLLDGVHGSALPRPSFPDFPVLDFGSVYGMRRAFSDGDIKALGNGDVNLIQSPVGQPKLTSICTSEDRREKLSRYRSKKSKRNFGRKIKYACRKALADSQPRIRGRFAKTE